VELELRPEATERELAAVRAGVVAAGLDLAPDSATYRSPWRRAGLIEGLDREPRATAYAPSPRRRRGATRA
jgi:hypothetical protein